MAEGSRKHLQEQFDAARHKVAAAEERGEALWTQIGPLLLRVDLEREDVEPEGKVPRSEKDRPSDHEAPLHRAEELIRRIRDLGLLRWMSWPVTVVIGIVVAAAGSLSALWIEPRFLGVAAGLLAGLLVALLVRKTLYGMAHRRVGALGDDFAILLAQSRRLGAEFIRETEERVAQQRTAVNNKHVAERRQAQAVHKPRLEELLRGIRSERDAIEDKFQETYPVRRQQAARPWRRCASATTKRGPRVSPGRKRKAATGKPPTPSGCASSTKIAARRRGRCANAGR